MTPTNERPPFPDGRVFLAQPGRQSGGDADSHQAFWVGAVKPGDRLDGKVTRAKSHMSLLCCSFNRVYSHALNLRLAFENGRDAARTGKRKVNPYTKCHKGATDFLWEHWLAGWEGRLDQRVDYFAMIHDDVVPDDGWLTALQDEMFSSGADLLSAVIPLKDYKGVTSTAIDDPNDPWVTERRLTMAEAHGLPETFSAADCGYPDRMLLANTGLWIVRLDLPFTYDRHEDGSLKLCFTTRDRVVFDPGSNQFKAQTSSEDWEFSRDFQRLGGKVMCTRKVKLNHMGALPFDNRSGDWGTWDHDHETSVKYGGKPIAGVQLENPWEPDVDSHPPTGWSDAYPNVRGWFTDVEGTALAEICQGKDVLEIGTYAGLSTMWIVQGCAHVTCVDTFDGRGTNWAGDTLKEFGHNLKVHHPDFDYSKLSVCVGTTKEVIPKLERRYDVAFLDGAHDSQSVAEDIDLSLSVLKPDGLLAFHDVGSQEHPEVTIMIQERLLNKGAKFMGRFGSLGFVDPGPMLEKTAIEKGYDTRTTGGLLETVTA